VSRTQQLLAHNAKVYLAARNAQKVDEAIAELKNETGKEAIFLQLDLADIPAIRRSAQEFLSCVSYLFSLCLFSRVFRNESQLHVLINNA
jgi:retinol dehydrogenase-12